MKSQVRSCMKYARMTAAVYFRTQHKDGYELPFLSDTHLTVGSVQRVNSVDPSPMARCTNKLEEGKAHSTAETSKARDQEPRQFGKASHACQLRGRHDECELEEDRTVERSQYKTPLKDAELRVAQEHY